MGEVIDMDQATNPVRSHLSSVLNGKYKTSQANCRIHGEYESILMPNGKWSPCPDCHAEEQAAERNRENRRQGEAQRVERIEKLRGDSLIPRRFSGKTLDSFSAETRDQQRTLAICKAYVDRFDDRLAQGGGMTLLGSVGTGKSHLAYGIGNALLAQGRRVMGIDVYELIDLIKERAFDKRDGTSEREAIKTFVSDLDLLILDEIGAQLGSEWEMLTLFKVVNERYKQQLPTILISNLSQLDLKEYLGERIVDRMQEGGGATLTLDWESYRSKRGAE